MRAVVIVLVAALSVPVLAGCWDRREITDLALVSAAAVDRAGDGRVRVTAVVEKPGRAPASAAGAGGAGVKPIFEASESDSVAGAVKRIASHSSRRPFWSHTSVLVVGEEQARAGMAPVLDWFDRDREPRRLMWLLVCEGEGGAFLRETTAGSEESPAEKITGSLRISPEVSLGLATNMHEFLKAFGSASRDPVVGLVRVGHEAEGRFCPEICGAAVFRGDRMVGSLDESETRGMLYVTGRVRGGVIEIPAGQGGEQAIALDIKRVRRGISVSQDAGMPRVSIRLTIEASVGDVPSTIDVRHRDVLRRMEGEAARVVEGQVRAAIDRCRYYQADVFGFGEQVRRRLPQVWAGVRDRWRESFSAIGVDVDVVVRITGTGAVSVRSNPEG